MTMRYRTECIVLEKKDSMEADRIFSVFTKDFGKINLYAKAIRKINSKLKSGVEVFYHSEIEFIQGKNRKTLTDASVIKTHSFLQSRKENIEIMGMIFELLDNFVKGQEKDEKTFELIMQTLGGLKEGEIKEKILAYYYFLWNFLSLQGYHFEVENCVSCKKDLEPECVYLSCNNGGTVCASCAPKYGKTCRRTDKDAVKILRLILNKDWQTVSKLKINEPLKTFLFEISESAVKAFIPS
jgi:DNA repair protein RecO (recombination protein O)